jgi:anaerobic ribonucleoside-triphosphate reductase activating protein
MYIGQIFTADCANGLGMRVSVFVSGCTNHCEGCFQPETWDFTYGQPYTKETEDFIMEELAHPYYDGLTILGGEPFEPSNQEELVKLIRRVKSELPARNIWMYTGFVYEEDLVPGGSRHTAVTDEILDKIDILVDGRFELAQKNIMLKFRGSSNQRIIEMPPTRAQGNVVLSSLNG